uniref:Motile sperm domain-containing protein 3 n=1 Tax=Oryctolagus cuniculus TaxID=9986 RepID=G1T232_RABIT
PPDEPHNTNGLSEPEARRDAGRAQGGGVGSTQASWKAGSVKGSSGELYSGLSLAGRRGAGASERPEGAGPSEVGGTCWAREPSLTRRPGLGAPRGRFSGVGVAIEVGFGAGSEGGPGAKLGRGQVCGTWAWVSGGPLERGSEAAAVASSVQALPHGRILSPALDSRPCPSSALGCPTAQSLHAPRGAPGPGAVFRADQRSGLRQLLTLYNPTGTALCFRVLCTAPAKYTVFEAEGYVKAQSCIDIVIRHVAPIPSHYDVRDRFRIELSEEGANGRVVGRKDITSVLRAPAHPLELQGQPNPLPTLGPPAGTAAPTARPFQETPRQQLATSSFLLFLLTGMVSVAFLLLPLQDEVGSQLPQVLHVSLGQKLVAAYVLGLLTVVFLWT